MQSRRYVNTCTFIIKEIGLFTCPSLCFSFHLTGRNRSPHLSPPPSTPTGTTRGRGRTPPLVNLVSWPTGTITAAPADRPGPRTQDQFQIQFQVGPYIELNTVDSRFIVPAVTSYERPISSPHCIMGKSPTASDPGYCITVWVCVDLDITYCVSRLHLCTQSVGLGTRDSNYRSINGTKQNTYPTTNRITKTRISIWGGGGGRQTKAMGLSQVYPCTYKWGVYSEEMYSLWNNIYLNISISVNVIQLKFKPLHRDIFSSLSGELYAGSGAPGSRMGSAPLRKSAPSSASSSKVGTACYSHKRVTIQFQFTIIYNHQDHIQGKNILCIFLQTDKTIDLARVLKISFKWAANNDF